MNIGLLLDAFGGEPHIPQYCSALFIELHKDLDQDVHVIKVRNREHVTARKLQAFLGILQKIYGSRGSRGGYTSWRIHDVHFGRV